MWREHLSQHQLALSAPAGEAELQQAEEDLGIAFPPDLRRLLAETDGALDANGEAFILPVAGIVKATRELWAQDEYGDAYMAFRPHLYFAKERSGDHYFFRVLAGRVDDDVFAWFHEEDVRRPYGSGLGIKSYIETRLEEHRSRQSPQRDDAIVDALLNCLAFIELSPDDVIDPDDAVRALESAVFTLRRGSRDQQRRFISQATARARTEPYQDRAAFFRSFGESLRDLSDDSA